MFILPEYATNYTPLRLMMATSFFVALSSIQSGLHAAEHSSKSFKKEAERSAQESDIEKLKAELRQDAEIKQFKANLEQNINEKDLHGNTPLHFTVLSPADNHRLYPQYGGASLNDVDDTRSQTVAGLILMKADVEARNKQGLTPLQIAAANAEKFPKTYEVLQAGHRVQHWIPYIPKPINGQNHTWQEAFDAVNHPENKKCVVERSHAMATLEKYAASNQQSAQ